MCSYKTGLFQILFGFKTHHGKLTVHITVELTKCPQKGIAQVMYNHTHQKVEKNKLE